MLLFGNTFRGSVPQRTRGKMCWRGQRREALGCLAPERGVAITGLHAREDLCQAFFPAYQGEFLLDTAMEILTLRELIPPACVPGLARTATLADLKPWLGCSRLSSGRSSWKGNHAGSDGGKKYAGRIREGKVYLSRPQRASLSLRHKPAGSWPAGPCISGVYTPPEHRRRGYCQTLVAHLPPAPGPRPSVSPCLWIRQIPAPTEPTGKLASKRCLTVSTTG